MFDMYQEITILVIISFLIIFLGYLGYRVFISKIKTKVKLPQDIPIDPTLNNLEKIVDSVKYKEKTENENLNSEKKESDEHKIVKEQQQHTYKKEEKKVKAKKSTLLPPKMMMYKEILDRKDHHKKH